MNNRIKAIGLAALLLVEGSATMIGLDIKQGAQKYYDKRERVEITQQTVDYRTKLGDALFIGGFAALMITGAGVNGFHYMKRGNKI